MLSIILSGLPAGSSVGHIGQAQRYEVPALAFCAGWIAAVCGSITAVPFIAAITFFAVTFTYKCEKKMIVDQVRANVVMAGIAAAIDMVTELELALMPPVRAVAADFVWSCLRVWDGVLGWRALVDSHGKPFGIWLDKFNTVRSASMLLAIQRVNAAIQASSAGFPRSFTVNSKYTETCCQNSLCC